MVIVLPPCINNVSCINSLTNPGFIRTFITKAITNALDKSVLCRLAWMNKPQRHCVFESPLLPCLAGWEPLATVAADALLPVLYDIVGVSHPSPENDKAGIPIVFYSQSISGSDRVPVVFIPVGFPQGFHPAKHIQDAAFLTPEPQIAHAARTSIFTARCDRVDCE